MDVIKTTKLQQVPPPTMQEGQRGKDIYFRIAGLLLKRGMLWDVSCVSIEVLAHHIATQLEAICRLQSCPYRIHATLNNEDIQDIRQYCQQVPGLTMQDIEQLGYLDYTE